MHAGGRVRQRLVLLYSARVLRLRDRVVRIALRARVLVDEAGLRMLLPGEVLELGHPRVRVLVRVVDHRDRLMRTRCSASRTRNSQRAIRQLAVAVVEELVDRAR